MEKENGRLWQACVGVDAGICHNINDDSDRWIKNNGKGFGEKDVYIQSIGYESGGTECES